MTLCGLIKHLARLDLQLVAETALATQAEAIAERARAAGAGGGEVQAAGPVAVVGWHSAALRRRERGDVGVPPQPLLASVVAAQGSGAAEAVSAAVADALRGA